MSEALPEPEALIDAMASVLRLTIEPDYRPGIVLNLEITAAYAALLFERPLGDHAEPAPVFRP